MLDHYTINKELNELRDVRNWSYHLPLTHFVAAKKVYLKNIPKELHQYVGYSFNPIKISIANKCNIKFLESLYIHSNKRINVFKSLYRCMLKDFEKILGETVSVIEVPEQPIELLGEITAAIQLSMAMNRRKYDGSNESYEKITFQKPIADED